MAGIRRISPCLWFEHQAVEAARFYVSVFDGTMGEIIPYPKSDHPAHVGREGKPMVVTFRLWDQDFTALNAEPLWSFNPAVSLQVFCDTQAEIDHYWEKLGEGGDPRARECGWLADRYGLSWQIVPTAIDRWMTAADPVRSAKAMAAVLTMKKLVIADIEAALAR